MFTLLQAATAQDSAAAVSKATERIAVTPETSTAAGTDLGLILSIVAVVIAVLAAAAAVLAYLRAASMAKKSAGSSEQSGMIDQKINVKLNSMLVTLKKECASETERMIGAALNTFEQKLKNQARIAEEKSHPAQQPEQPREVPAYPSKTWYACSMNGKFDELDFSELQGERESFIIRTTSDTTADVSLNPDFDRNLILEVKDVCEVAEGNWQSFNIVTVVSDGTISKPSRDSQSWNIVKKIVVKLG